MINNYKQKLKIFNIIMIFFTDKIDKPVNTVFNEVSLIY